MRTIYKYPMDPMFLYPDDQLSIQAPADAKFLHIKEQGQTPQVWVEVDTDRPTATYTIAVTGTGQPIPDGFHEYIGTIHEGTYVWHYHVRR